MFEKDEDITIEAVMKKLVEIVAVRGKKGTSRNQQVGLLEELRDVALAASLPPAVIVKIHFNIVAAVFDYNTTVSTCMKPDMWLQ